MIENNIYVTIKFKAGSGKPPEQICREIQILIDGIIADIEEIYFAAGEDDIFEKTTKMEEQIIDLENHIDSLDEMIIDLENEISLANK